MRYFESMHHYIGFWPETIYDDFCFPQELPLCSDAALRTSLVRYLQSGRVETIYRRGYSSCKYKCGISRRGMGYADMTDGTWVWPEGLAHYVEVHHISLPAVFVASVLANEHRQPPPPGPRAAFDFWRSWCDAQRSDSSRDLIQDLKRQCEIEIDERLDEYFERVAQERGTSGSKCIWKGCAIESLKGVVFCARHLLIDTGGGEHGEVISSVRERYTREFLNSFPQAGC